MFSSDSVHLQFDVTKPSPHRGWVKYFVAALGLGMGTVQAQEQKLLDYWWVMPREEVQNAPRVIRVIGAKGEKFEEVYAEEQAAALRGSAAIMQARLERQAALRLEAQQRARELREAGKSPAVAYEEAWAEVYSRRWLNADWRVGSSKLEDMLARMASDNADFALTEEEQQWVLEALLEDDDRLESSEGIELLRNLARRLRSMGYGKINVTAGVNDELMMRFADAMHHGKESMAAYRDALFKTNRDRVMHHELRGYVAPWGMGAGGTRSYRQAPVVLTPSAGTGSTQQPQLPGLTALTVGQSYTAPGLNAVPGAQSNFLATAPDAEEKEEEKEKDEEEPFTATSAPASPAAPAPRMMMARSMSLRSTGAVTLAEEIVADYIVGAGKNTSFHTTTSVNGQTLTRGNIHNAAWNAEDSYSYTNSSYWGSATATVDFGAWNTADGGVQIADTPESFGLTGGNLYLGTGFSGNIAVSGEGNVLHAESLKHESKSANGGFLGWVSATAHAVYQVPGSDQFRYGTLSGSGELTLSNNAAANNAVIYIFNDAEATGWFDGTIRFGASCGGIVELDLGADSDSSAAWSQTVFDMSGIGQATDGYGISTSDAPTRTILNVRGNVSIAGLKNGGANSTVTSESGDFFYDLTLGDVAGADYVYDGTFNGAYYTSATQTNGSSTPSALDLIKVGENQQTITTEISSTASRLHTVEVKGGALRFDADSNYYDDAYSMSLETNFVTVSGGRLLVNDLNVTGVQEGAAEFLVTGGEVEANGDITVAYDMGVMGGGSVSAANVSAGNNLGVSGTGSSLTITGSLETLAMRVEDGGHLVADDITVQSNLEVGTESRQVANITDAQRATLISSGSLTAGELRLRGDGLLQTGDSAITLTGAHMHGGAVWKMEGGQNTLNGLLRLENVGGTDGKVTFSGPAGGGVEPAVLTLPGMVSLADANWDGGRNALFHLDNVQLDFRLGVTLTNTGIPLTEGTVLTLASTAKGGGYVEDSTTWVRVESSDALYHGVLGYDAQQNVIITIQHKLIIPQEMASGDLLYIEMYQDAHDPALPYKAHDTYSGGSWSGDPENIESLIRFSNLQISEGADLYLGENLKTGNEGTEVVDYRADRHFGGNIDVIVTTTAGDAAQLHGEIGDWGNWYLDGHLGGSGALKLVAHNTLGTRDLNPSTDKESDTTTSKTYQYGTASTFTFTDYATPEAWFSGTLSLADPHGGIVQLNIGNVNIADAGDTRWKNTLIDLTRSAMTDRASGQSGTATEQVLGLVGDAQVAGVMGKDGAFIVSNVKAGSGKPSPVLTIGSDMADYTFSGTVGDGRFYTGGQATGKTTTTTTTTTTANSGTVTTTTTSTVETNFQTMENGALSLTKVGSNTQTFSGSVYLDQVLVKEGTLALKGGTIDIESMEVLSGANLQTASGAVMDSLTLHGDSTWEMMGDTNRYLSPLYLTNMSGGGANITSTDPLIWSPSRYMNLSGANLTLLERNTLTAGGEAIFEVGSGITLDLSNPHVLTNVSGAAPNRWIALFGKVSQKYESLPKDMILVEDEMGNFYDAAYIQNGETIYLQLGEARDYGIVVNEHAEPHTSKIGYIWSGEDNGTTDGDVHHINLTMGSIWRADGSAENTGWHEQRAAGSSNDDIGKYVDGNTVWFLDKDVHGSDEKHRMVDIVGNVAPGEIIIESNLNAGFVDPKPEDAEYHMEYSYAFVSKDGTGCITDYVDAEGEVIPTSITMKGTGLVVLNLTNNFSGGIDVQNGGIYVATVGAAGTGALTFHTDQEWSFKVQGLNNGVVDTPMERLGSELMICYQHSDDAVSGFRGSSLRNDIILSSTKTTAENDFEGRFKVSFAYAAFNESGGGDSISNIPRHWRNLTLSGALVGTGYEATDAQGNKIWVNTSANDTLELTGYCSTWANERDQSYTTAITLNEDTVGEGSYIYDGETGEILNRFQGKVVLMNTVNTSPLPSNKLEKRTAGSVQLVLKGEKLSQAHLDMTRESVKMGRDENNNATAYEESAHRDLPRQTYNNILMVNGDATLKGLSAKFHGCGWDYPEDNSSDNDNRIGDREFIADMKQHDEVWHVRTLTNGLNTLRLGEVGDSANNSTYIYSGAMGFAQAYIGTSQAHVPWGDGFMEHTASWYFGGHSVAKESLSLVKASASSQYIHTAVLDDVSVYEGTLGFNNLNLKGNLNLVGGTTTKLGVTTEAGWDSISEDAVSGMQTNYKVVPTSEDVTLNPGKTLLVFTPNTGAGTEPTAAVVDGNVIMKEGTALTFLPNGMVPDYTYDKSAAAGVRPVNPLLDVNGTLQFLDASPEQLSINLTGVNFSQVPVETRENTYFYLAEADNIVIGEAEDSSKFQSRIMSLGYGYFGVLDTLDSSGGEHASTDGKDYLVIRVYGDPRCTWSGKTEVDGNEIGNVWVHSPDDSLPEYDYRWKENSAFQDGMTVLFGNLYEPVRWTKDSKLTSTDTPVVKLNALQAGHPATEVTVDGHKISWTAGPDADYKYKYENVVIQGRVAPLSVVINSDYFDSYDTGRVAYPDTTNYIFTISGEDESYGYIADATEDELKVWKESYKVENLDWKTNLTKLGKGTAIMTTDNRFTGGTEILGGRIVMQHVNALGFVYNNGAYATPEDPNDDKTNLDDQFKDKLLTGLDCTITLMNGGELMADFSDDAFPGNHQENITTSMGAALDTTTIRNKVVVNVYANPDDPDYDTLVDGRIFNNTAHKLVLSTLVGESDTVVEFAGVGLTADQSSNAYGVDNKFRYGVFKVLDPSGFSGTVTLTGKHWELSEDGKTADLVNGGNVQLNLMSHTKSEGKDWTKATVDLSIKDGTDRTVLGLDATGQATDVPGYECVYLNSIHGQVKSGSSSVLNMSAHNELTLILTGTRSGAYEGVMGYGDFEVSVDYGGYAGLHGTTQHHYGAIGFGSLNLIKEGEGSTQSARRAWLNSVTVQGGTFKADEALVARTLTTGGGKRVMVGDVDQSTLYALSVGKGGTLAMNTTFNVSGTKEDAWEGVEAGTTVGDSTRPAGWVLLEDGATLSAREDWYTRKQVDMAPGAHVTINTRNFIVDPYLTVQHDAQVKNEVVNKYEYSHIIQLLGQFSGSNVHLTFNNLLTNANNKDAYMDLKGDSPNMGYVALNDLNALKGSSTVYVDSMTALQLLNANGGVKADVDIIVAGKNATLQILDQVTNYDSSHTASTSDSMVQYIDRIRFGANVDINPNEDPLHRENTGQLLLGGVEQRSLAVGDSRLNTPNTADRQVIISSRHNTTDWEYVVSRLEGKELDLNDDKGVKLQGEVTNLNIDMRGSAVKLGGDAATRSEMNSVHVDLANSDISHTIYQTNLRNSLVHLMEDCSVNIADMVLVNEQSVIRGVKLEYVKAGDAYTLVGNTVNPYDAAPNVAAGNNPTSKTKEVSTSVNTTVQLTFADKTEVCTSANGTRLLVLQADQLLGVDVTGNGLTLRLHEDMFQYAYEADARFVGVMMGGDSGQFLYEADNTKFGSLLDSQFVLQDSTGQQLTGHWVTSTYVGTESGESVSRYMLYFEVPEPATTTLSLLALTALCARRRRK
ncbi:MAG: hypothetical protein IJN23_06675 [Akkermansia sp.]|nr:hypothetical protein [Akkermansia sp.]